MPSLPTPLLFLSLLTLLTSTQAYSLSFSRVSSPSPSTSSSISSLSNKDSSKSQDSSDVFQYANLNNASGSDIYVATVQLAGKDYVVQLDTGSSDLWIDTTGADLGSFTNTGIQTGLTYG